LEVIPKKGLRDFCERKFVGISRTKLFGQRSFAPPKMACSYTYGKHCTWSRPFDLGKEKDVSRFWLQAALNDRKKLCKRRLTIE